MVDPSSLNFDSPQGVQDDYFPAKGGHVSLSKQVPGLNRVRFGLGWDLRKTDGADFDLDASAFLLNADGQVLSNQHFIYYNNPIDPSGAVAHQGDNRTGEGDGDDEVIDIDLGKLPWRPPGLFSW